MVTTRPLSLPPAELPSPPSRRAADSHRSRPTCAPGHGPGFHPGAAFPAVIVPFRYSLVGWESLCAGHAARCWSRPCFFSSRLLNWPGSGSRSAMASGSVGAGNGVGPALLLDLPRRAGRRASRATSGSGPPSAPGPHRRREPWSGITPRPRSNYLLGSVQAVVYLYPLRKSGFYLKTGFGMAQYSAKDDQDEVSTQALAGQVGVGYEVPVNRGIRLSLTPTSSAPSGADLRSTHGLRPLRQHQPVPARCRRHASLVRARPKPRPFRPSGGQACEAFAVFSVVPWPPCCCPPTALLAACGETATPASGRCRRSARRYSSGSGCPAPTTPAPRQSTTATRSSRPTASATTPGIRRWIPGPAAPSATSTAAIPAGSQLFGKVGPIPFGLANEALETWDPQNPRREDHFGHKIDWENDIEFVRQDGLTGALFSVKCDVLAKLHQGTHSKDAFTNNLHEIAYHLQCTDGTEMHVTLMSAIGTPGGFTRTCDGAAGGCRGAGAGQLSQRRRAAGHSRPDLRGPDHVRGRRRTSGPTTTTRCTRAGRPPTRCGPKNGRTVAHFNPYFQVFFPSRFYDPAAPNITGRPIAECDLLDPAATATTTSAPSRPTTAR